MDISEIVKETSTEPSPIMLEDDNEEVLQEQEGEVNIKMEKRFITSPADIVLCMAVWSGGLFFNLSRVIILCMIVCTVIHNCSSSGSLFFALLRWNN